MQVLAIVKKQQLGFVKIERWRQALKKRFPNAAGWQFPIRGQNFGDNDFNSCILTSLRSVTVAGRMLCLRGHALATHVRCTSKREEDNRMKMRTKQQWFLQNLQMSHRLSSNYTAIPAFNVLDISLKWWRHFAEIFEPKNINNNKNRSSKINKRE